MPATDEAVQWHGLALPIFNESLDDSGSAESEIVDAEQPPISAKNLSNGDACLFRGRPASVVSDMNDGYIIETIMVVASSI